MTVIDNFQPGVSFWDVNPQFLIVNPFKRIYDDDKSKLKKNSSLLMWFVAFCYDRRSKYFKLQPDGEDGKHYIIGLDYCGNPNFYTDNKENLDECIAMFIKMSYTPMERHLKTWEDLLDKRTKFLQSQDYDLDTYEDLDKMAVGTQKVHQTIKQVLDDLSKEDVVGSAKGGAQPSLND